MAQVDPFFFFWSGVGEGVIESLKAREEEVPLCDHSGSV